MTTEVVVMNPAAVVLAADSTLTVQVHGARLHYHGVDKIFSLGGGHTVAIMVNGTNTFMGFPWETIIKSYRSVLLARPYGTVEQYGEEFITFVRKFGANFVSEDAVGEAIENYSVTFLLDIINLALWEMRGRGNKRQLETFVKEAGGAEGGSEVYVKRKLLEMLPDIASGVETDLLSKPDYKEPGSRFAEEARAAFGVRVEAALGRVMENLGLEEQREALPPDVVKKLVGLPFLALQKKRVKPLRSQIVIAGFGGHEMLPSTFAFDITMFAMGCLIARNARLSSVNAQAKAFFQCYGETEMVHSFLNGISERFREDFGAAVKGLRGRESELRQIAGQHFDNIADDLERRFRRRILETIAHLPKQSLAGIAENLIVLSSIKSHIKDVNGSVGGPVSVCIISRGDGLVWLRNQHYFDIAKNPHFLARYQKPVKLSDAIWPPQAEESSATEQHVFGSFDQLLEEEI